MKIGLAEPWASRGPARLFPGKVRQEKANAEEATGLLDSSRGVPEAEGKVVFIGLSKLVFIPEGKKNRDQNERL